MQYICSFSDIDVLFHLLSNVIFFAKSHCTFVQSGYVFLQAVERGNKECPICLTFLEDESLVEQLPVASAATSITTDYDPKSKQHQGLLHEQKAKPTTGKTSIHLKTRSFQHKSQTKMSTPSSERAKNSPNHSNSAKPRVHSGMNNEGTKVL